MPRSPHLAHAVTLVIATLAAGACRSGSRGNASPDPGPSMPPPAAAAAPSGVVTDEEMQDVKVVRAEELLRGRFAGVEVIPIAGGGISVRIRGATSVNGSTEPLFVVDGVPIQAEPGGALKGLAPQDVAKIEVLKDIGSTAFYGVRGANGVVLITTKH